jgi:hypothetical protein
VNDNEVCVTCCTAEQPKSVSAEEMSDVEPDDDANMVVQHAEATPDVLHDQPARQVSTSAFYGARKSRPIDCHVRGSNNTKVSLTAPCASNTRRKCLPPKRFDE